jgi:hypothetical protein
MTIQELESEFNTIIEGTPDGQQKLYGLSEV